MLFRSPLEAQACGTPVVALGRGGARETVIPGITGILYPDPGAEELAAAIERASTIRWNRAELRANALRFSEESFRENLLNALSEAFTQSGRTDLALWVHELRNHSQAIQ